jgi:hypothetical protein
MMYSLSRRALFGGQRAHRKLVDAGRPDVRWIWV